MSESPLPLAFDHERKRLTIGTLSAHPLVVKADPFLELLFDETEPLIPLRDPKITAIRIWCWNELSERVRIVRDQAPNSAVGLRAVLEIVLVATYALHEGKDEYYRAEKLVRRAQEFVGGREVAPTDYIYNPR